MIRIPARTPPPLRILVIDEDADARTQLALCLEADGNHVNALRVRSFPFSTTVEDFIHEHDKVFIVEQNRDAQLRTMLMADFTLDARKLVPVLHYDGTPITARFIAGDMAKKLDQMKVVPFEKAAS